MPASYPGAVKTFTPVVDGVTEVVAANVNDPYLEITAIETELGTDVAASATDLKTRLAWHMNAYGKLAYPDPTELTISSGAITVTQNIHYVDTQSDAASDDLDTITAPSAAENWTVYLRIAADARNVVLKHNTGNLYLAGGVDATLDLTSDLAICQFDHVLDKWLVITSKSGPLLAAANIYTGLNYFNGGVANKVTDVVGNLTLDSTYNILDVSCTAGDVTLTLPAVATYPGIQYTICKIDSTTAGVIIDGDSSETINGSTTKTLSAQYDTATIIASTTEWRVL